MDRKERQEGTTMAAMDATDTMAEWANSNAVRLSAVQWLIVLVLFLASAIMVPRAWPRLETWHHGGSYRVPYALSRDYWLYEQHLRKSARDPRTILVLGDSVVWGEYVDRTGTVTHFLSDRDQPASDALHYVNAGVNGMFPLALEGLVRHYAAPVYDRQVILHCNLLWMTSPEQDLSAPKERTFNHQELVPQFFPELPCYRAPFTERLGNVVRRRIAVFGWVRHLQACYYDHLSIPAWTLASTNGSSNALSPPWAPLTMRVPDEPEDDPERGLDSPRHVPWTQRGMQRQSFDWVAPEDSLQWGAFRRLVQLLRDRGNQVAVVIGPLNEHMLDEPSQRALTLWEQTVSHWLDEQHVPWTRPAVLDSDDYADVSHPLTEGYRALSQAWQWSAIAGGQYDVTPASGAASE